MSHGAPSPDDSIDKPEETWAGIATAKDTCYDVQKGLDAKAGEGDEDWDGDEWGDGSPESPHKPGNIDGVYIDEFDTLSSCSLGISLNAVTVSEAFTPEAVGWVWVVVRIDTKVDPVGDDST